jgi:hypothetical protein
VISAAEIQGALELTSAQIEALAEVLGALSVLNRPPGSDWPAPGSEQLFVHEVTFFLFVLLYAKEAQRPDQMELWPEAAALQPVGPAVCLQHMNNPTDSLYTMHPTVTRAEGN